MPLRPEAECLEPLQQKEGTKGVQRRSEVTQHFDAGLDRERDRAKRLAEFQPMVALRRLCERRKPPGARPIEFPCAACGVL